MRQYISKSIPFCSPIQGVGTVDFKSITEPIREVRFTLFDSHVSSTFHHLTLLPSYSPHIRLNKPHQRSTTKYATSKQPPTKSIPSPNPYPVPPSSAKATPVKLNPLIYPTIVSSLVSEHKPPLSALRESKSIVIT